jgi:hypothetical protein
MTTMPLLRNDFVVTYARVQEKLFARVTNPRPVPGLQA